MKNNFIKTFLEVIAEFPEVISGLMIKESMANKMIRLGGQDPRTIFKGFQNLQQRKFIRPVDGGYRIMRRGANWLKKIKFRNLSIDEQKRDGKWRVVIFDIPEEVKYLRDSFRHKLQSLNFFQLQRSVFVCPFSCDDEIKFIVDYLRIKDYTSFILADSPGSNESEIRDYYKI